MSMAEVNTVILPALVSPHWELVVWCELEGESSMEDALASLDTWLHFQAHIESLPPDENVAYGELQRAFNERVDQLEREFFKRRMLNRVIGHMKLTGMMPELRNALVAHFTYQEPSDECCEV